MNIFILVAGAHFVPPSKTTGNWLKSYPSLAQLNADVKRVREGEFSVYYEILGQKYDWYEVIDLTNWLI